jgi:alpha-tubulin suppressor-like RCC1 family protein
MPNIFEVYFRFIRVKLNINFKAMHLGKNFGSLIKSLLCFIIFHSHSVKGQIADGGDLHNMVVCKDSTVWVWGSNVYYQLGNGTTSAHPNPYPVQVKGIAGIVAVSAGNSHSMALRKDGTIWIWGENRFGELGDGTTITRSSPKQLQGLNNIIAIGASQFFSMALKDDGTVWAWGNNQYGQLGDGTSTDRYTPVKVTGLSNINGISVGIYHVVALKADSTVWAWGINNEGQLGNGTTNGYNPNPVPAKVSGISGVTGVAAGSLHSMALKADSTVWAWGGNDVGELGNGDSLKSLSPVPAINLTKIVAIASRSSHSIALKDDGTIWMWGQNPHGQLGNNTFSGDLANPIPLQVPGLNNITHITTGDYFTMVVQNDDILWTWGGGFLQMGQLGDGTLENRPFPTQIMSLQNCDTLAYSICENPSDIGAFDIYPNPASSVFYAKFVLRGKENSLCLQVHDMYGRQVFVKEIPKLSPGIHTLEYDINDLAKGLYLISITNGLDRLSKQLTIIRE